MVSRCSTSPSFATPCGLSRIWLRTLPDSLLQKRQSVKSRLGERALGVDYGQRRVGLAVSVGINPRQLQPIWHKNNAREAAREVSAAAERTVSSTIVVGLPVDRQGREGLQARKTRQFLDALQTYAPWAHIVTLNEQLTTAEAHYRLADRGVQKGNRTHLVDGVAAGILLERFFSDADEELPQVLQAGSGTMEHRVEGGENRKSFAAWRREAMERARVVGSELQRSR